MDYIAQPKDYWIARDAINITLNAMGNPNRTLATVSGGAAILCYIEGVEGLGYDNGHHFKTWPLTVSPTKFNSNTEKYVYVAIPRTVKAGTQAVVVFPSEKLDIYGVNASDAQVGSTDYYYIWLQGIITATDGTTARDWSQRINTGRKGTDEDLYDDTTGEWYQYSKTTGLVTFLKDIIMKSGTTFRNLILGDKELTGVATGDTAIDYVDSETLVVTPSYLNERYLAKFKDDSTPYSLSVGKNLNVGGKTTVNNIQSPNFAKGLVGGNGFGVYKDDNGYWTAEIDKLIVRVKAVLSELEIRKLSYAGGNFTFSPSGSIIESVVPLNEAGEKITGEEKKLSLYRVGQKFIRAVNGLLGKKSTVTPAPQTVYAYRCYNVADDGTTATMNNWRPGDQARCQTGNLASHSSKESLEDVAQNRHYWRLVLRTGSEWLGDGKVHDYVDIAAGYRDVLGSSLPSWVQTALGSYYDARRIYHLSSSNTDDVPQAEDVIVSEGHQSTDTARQNVVRIITNDDSGGAIIMYTGIDDFSLPQSKETFRASADLFRVLSKNIVITTDNGATESLDSYISGGTNILGGVKDGLGWEFRKDGSSATLVNYQMTWSEYNIQLENVGRLQHELCLVSPVLYLEAGSYCFSLDNITNTSFQAFIAQSNTLSDFDTLSSSWASGTGKNRVNITLFKPVSTDNRYRTFRLNVGSYKYSRIVLSHRYDAGEEVVIGKLQLAKGTTSIFHEPTPTSASMFKMTNDNISLFVIDSLKQRTGINITNGLIQLIAERVKVQNPSGTPLAVFEMVQSSGGTLVPRFKTELIQAKQVVAEGIKTQTIDAENATIENLNVSGVFRAKVLYQSFKEVSYDTTAKEYPQITPSNAADIMVFAGPDEVTDYETGLAIDVFAEIPGAYEMKDRTLRLYGYSGPSSRVGLDWKSPRIKVSNTEYLGFISDPYNLVGEIRLYPSVWGTDQSNMPYVEIISKDIGGGQYRWLILNCADCQLVMRNHSIYEYKTTTVTKTT